MSDPLTPATAPFADLGISGVTRYGAISRVYEEFLKDLQGPAGMKLYREAIDNCPVIGAFLFALQHLSRGVTFRVEPADGAGVDRQMAAKIAERVKGALFDDLDVSWPDQLSEILSMVPYGWSFCEITMKRCLGPSPQHGDPATSVMPQPLLGGATGQGPQEVEFTPSKFSDGWVAWKSWGLRSQDTLFQWEWDAASKPLVLQQMAPPDYRIRRVPLAKGLLFRTQVNKGNPEGRSAIRNAMPSYLFRKNLQIVEGIGIERDLAGYPVFQVIEPDTAKQIMPPDIWNTKDPTMVALNASIQKMIRNVRRDEQEGMLLPWWLKFRLESTGSRRAFDTNAIIQRYDQRIAIVMLADFIMLGHEAGGTKALASTKSSLFTTALNSFLNTVCAIVNRFAIPQLLRFNGIPPELAPALAHGDAENVPIEALGNYIAALAKAGMPLFPNADLEEALLESAKLPTSGVQNPSDAFTESGLSLETAGAGAPPGSLP